MSYDLCHCDTAIAMRDPKTGNCIFCGDHLALRHRNSAERKAEPIHSGVLMYFPDALAAVSRVSKAGNDKHNPGQPLHWARGKSTDQMDCATRHSLTPENVDPETGEIELAAQAWRVLAELQLAEERRLIQVGILPYSGICPDASLLTAEQKRAFTAQPAPSTLSDYAQELRNAGICTRGAGHKGPCNGSPRQITPTETCVSWTGPNAELSR